MNRQRVPECGSNHREGSFSGCTLSLVVMERSLFSVFKETQAQPPAVGNVSSSSAVAQQPHDYHREEKSVMLPVNRSGIIPLSLHPLTHCGTISVSAVSSSAQAPVPLYPCDTRPKIHCSNSREKREKPPGGHITLYCPQTSEYNQFFDVHTVD